MTCDICLKSDDDFDTALYDWDNEHICDDCFRETKKKLANFLNGLRTCEIEALDSYIEGLSLFEFMEVS